MRPLLAVFYFSSLALAVDDPSIIGYYIDGDKTITAKCTGESASFSTGGGTGGCVHLSLGKYTAASHGYSCYNVNTLLESVTVRDGDKVDADATSTTCAQIFGECGVLRIYEASPDVTPSAILRTCIEKLGLPTSAATLYRQLPGITSKPSSDSTAEESNGSSSSGDGNEGSGGSSKAGVIAGAVVGSVVGIGLLAGAAFLFWFLRKRSKPGMPQNPVPQNPVVENVATGPSELGGIGKTAEEIGKPEIDGQEKPATESAAELGARSPPTAELGSLGPSPLPHTQELSAQPTATELAGSPPLTCQSGSPGELPASRMIYEMPAEPYQENYGFPHRGN